MPANIELVPATADQEPIVANLLELYMHDFSEFLDLDLGPDGRFHYENLSRYWLEPDRHPFLIRIGGKWAGLVLVKRDAGISGHPADWDMAEFFIVRRYRRRRVGTEIAHQVWRRFPGRWHVRVMESNQPAIDFWRQAIAQFAGEAIHSKRVQKDDEYWHLFSFESKSLNRT